jgi:glucans biosynthesis protein C
MSAIIRRYDIDWLRVIAIGLLLLYHVAIGFQSWGIMIGFITNEKSWEGLWLPMSVLNVWRIPLLFFVSGMGVYFAMQQRSWKELLAERSTRVLIPFVFGIFVIAPAGIALWQYYNNFPISYNANPAHLWFLGNILAYVLLLSPLFYYLKRHENGKIAKSIRWIMSNPLGLFVVVLFSVAEVLVVKPFPFELYAMTWHGFFLGLIAFFFGFCFVFTDGFWKMILQWRWILLILAIALFITRLTVFNMRAPAYFLAIESDFWIFSILAFGHKYLNRSNAALAYLSQAAYPIYILHMIFLYLGSMLIFPMEIAVQLKFVLVLIFTFVGCFMMYEFLIRRINIIRPLFGVKMTSKKVNVKIAAI